MEAATEGTCSWLLCHPMYQEWTSSNRGLLWIKGKPGSGKSMLLRYVLDQTTADFSECLPSPSGADSDHHPSTLLLSFFFHDRGVELQKTPVGLFRTFLYQILKQAPDALQNLVRTYEDRCKSRGEPGKEWQWQLQEMQTFLSSALRQVLMSRPVRMFIDALDESGRDNALMLVSWFKSQLKSLSGAGSAAASFPCQVCFTCRHYPILSLDYGLEICVENENGEDISTFVHSELSESKIPPDLIIQRANGIFMWCRLVVRRLRLVEMDATASIEEEIKCIPPRLDDLYLDLVNSLERKTDSLRLMQWVCFSTRPLTLDELCWAMAMASQCSHRLVEQCQDDKNCVPSNEMFKRRLKSLSGGLIETVQSIGDEQSVELVQFIHQSAKDFFLTTGLSALMTYSTGPVSTDIDIVPAAHYQLSRSCLRYLGMEEFHNETGLFYLYRSQWIASFPFVDYAATQWAFHARQTEESRQADFMGLFRWPSDSILDGWMRIYDALNQFSKDRLPRGSNLMHLAVYRRLPGLFKAVVQKSLETGVDLDLGDYHGNSPLLLAAKFGQEDVLRLLLETGKVDANLQGQDYYTPLSWAARNGHEAVVNLLISVGKADIHLQNRDGCTPLALASMEGSEAIVQALLDSGADIDSKDNNGSTPLRWAAESGKVEVVELLLGTGKVDIKIKDQNGWTPLVWAARNGHEAVVRLLLKTSDADIEHRDVYGRTALSWTAEYGHEAVVWVLIAIGKAEITTKDDEGATPLSWAAREGRIAVVKVLLANGVIDVDCKDCEGRTALFYAARAGSETIVQQLLNTGKVDVDVTDKEGDTPLSVATKKGHDGVAKLLRPLTAVSPSLTKQSSTMSTAEDDGLTVVAESPAVDGNSPTTAGGDSYMSVKDRFSAVDANFAAVKNSGFVTAEDKDEVAVPSEVKPLAVLI